MIGSLGLILLCQLVGEGMVRGLALPLPSAVIGLMLLLVLRFLMLCMVLMPLPCVV